MTGVNPGVAVGLDLDPTTTGSGARWEGSGVASRPECKFWETRDRNSCPRAPSRPGAACLATPWGLLPLLPRLLWLSALTTSTQA